MTDPDKPPGDKENLPGSDALSLGRESSEQGGFDQLASRLKRYIPAKRRSKEMSAYLATIGKQPDSEFRRMRDEKRDKKKLPEWQAANEASLKLDRCGEWLHFRHYVSIDQVRLHDARFCKQTKLCALCAIRRSAKNLGVYLARYEYLLAQKPALRPYLATFTVRNGEKGVNDLLTPYKCLRDSFRRMRDRWRQLKTGNGWGCSALSWMTAGVGSYEFTNRGKGWHPHLHLVLLADHELLPAEIEALKAEWCKTTGCSDLRAQDVRPIDLENPVSGFVEVFKYSMKFQDLQLSDNWRAHLDLQGHRLLISCGDFRGVKLSSELTDEPLEEIPFIDLFYRFLPEKGSYFLVSSCAVYAVEDKVGKSYVQNNTNNSCKNDIDVSSETYTEM
jgi:plasmid rolling circle replication initiator protein Rep